ncbi:FeoA family protein [Spirochaeta africana]|uniref:Fe2+ transport system protein A n=1 Tax=Spirochaeta africana (strain ATCC 700263 / DSM 8902 / Z-7692) TaxID=889378 RepID=H9UIB3_SPIAZ|nr:FeoA family protein [Spirochaeta africana]AFG37256.1 Fe2+ transport system protein A [Spirochaeta africana DSM 8902]
MPRNHILTNACTTVGIFEGKLLQQSRLLRTVYDHLFYRSMIRREIAAADLPRDARVLHIGAGAVPFTAAALAKAGFQVDAVDCCRHAADKAAQFLQQTSPDYHHRVRCSCAQGELINLAGYDAVWISLHVPCAAAIIQRLHRESPNTVVIWRSRSPLVRRMYPRTQFDAHCHIPATRRFRRWTGNVSHIRQQGGNCSLLHLPHGQAATIKTVPEHGDLPSMSLRAGKKITYLGRAAFGGPCIVCIGNRRIAVCHRLARQIRVQQETA